MLLLPAASFAQRYSVRKITTDDGLSNSCVVSIAQDKTGCIWIATEEGLNRYDGNSFERFYKNNPANSLSGNELNCILDDPRDSVLWIATQRAGLNSFNYKTRQFNVFLPSDDQPDGISNEAITTISPSKDGNIWISSYWGGVDHYDKASGIFTHYNKCKNDGTLPTDAMDPEFAKLRRNYLIGLDRSVPKLRQANHCIGCGRCESHCPQNIRIPRELHKIDAFVEKLKTNQLFQEAQESKKG